MLTSLTLLSFGKAQTSLALLSLNRKVKSALLLLAWTSHLRSIYVTTPSLAVFFSPFGLVPTIIRSLSFPLFLNCAIMLYLSIVNLFLALAIYFLFYLADGAGGIVHIFLHHFKGAGGAGGYWLSASSVLLIK